MASIRTLAKNFPGVSYLKLGLSMFVLMWATKDISSFIKLRGVPARFNAKFSRGDSFSPIATLATAFVNNCQTCIYIT